MWYAYKSTPIGKLLLVTSEDGVRKVSFHAPPPPDDAEHNEEKLAPVIRQLDEYFEGNRKTFDLPLAPRGTPFQLAVWNALRQISYGDTRSYSDIARMIAKPAAVRAVGAANGANPIPIIIPCHRVIGSNGALTGFGGGLDVKRHLLLLEAGFRGLTASSPSSLSLY